MAARKKETPAPEEEILVLHEKWVKAAKEHLREIIIAALALVFLASLWALYNYYRQKRLDEATLLYARALMTTQKDQKLKLLAEVVRKYGGTTTGLEARLTLSEIYWEQKDLEKASRELKEALKKARGPIKISVSMGLGYVAEDQERLPEAEKYYQKAVQAHLGFEEIAYLDLARVAELQGKIEKAVRYYQEVVSLKPSGEKLDFIQVELSRLVEKVNNPVKEGEG